MDLSEDSIEYIANQELLEEKIYEYKQNFKTILADEELAIVYGVKKNEPVKTEKAKLPVTNNVENIQNIESNAAKIQKIEPIVVDIQNPEASVEKIQNKKPSVENIKKAESNITNIQKSEQKEEKKKVDLTIKRLQESILKIDNKNSSKERYMLKLIEEVGEAC